MITVFGSTNVDQIGSVSRIPLVGETVAGGDFSMSAGGKGANQALAARRAGSQVRHVTAVGDDSLTPIALGDLQAAAVDLSAVKTVPGASGIAMILVDPQGENVIAVLPGANAGMTADDAATAIALMDEADILLVQQEIPQEATLAALEQARGRGIRSILNTAPFLPSTAKAAELAAIVVANESEFALLAGCGPVPSVDDVKAWATAHSQIVVVTLGAKGVLASDGQSNWAVPAPIIEPVDTVGAGDTFCGYLADGLSQGVAMEQALQRATVAASLACLKPGAQPAIPLASDVEGALLKMSNDVSAAIA